MVARLDARARDRKARSNQVAPAQATGMNRRGIAVVDYKLEVVVLPVSGAST